MSVLGALRVWLLRRLCGRSRDVGYPIRTDANVSEAGWQRQTAGNLSCPRGRGAVLAVFVRVVVEAIEG